MRFKIDKSTRFKSSMLAGACIIGLSVWGWGLPIESVIVFFLLCLCFLAVIVSFAALFGWALRRLRKDDLDDI